MHTDWIAGNDGNWTDPSNWTNGVPAAGDSATIADGRPLLVDQTLHDEQINITPTGDQFVQMTLNGNDSFGARTVLSIDDSQATAGGSQAILFFGNMRDGGRVGGTFNNAGHINVTGNGAANSEAVQFQLSGGYTSFLFSNSGHMTVTNAKLDFSWPTAGSGDRPFVTNTGTIGVHSTAAGFTASFAAVGDPSYAPAAVRLMNDGSILIYGQYGNANLTTGSFNVVQGTGTISLEDGTASFVGDVGAGQTLNFINDVVQHTGGNVLNLNEAKASFDATITGFGKGDQINLGTVATSFTYDSATGVLTLSNATTLGATETLHFAGDYTADNFKLVQNGGNTALVFHKAQTTTWSGGSGNVSNPANWSNGVPQPGWTAIINAGSPTLTNAAIQGVTIDVGPAGADPASVAFTVNQNSSFDANTTLNILSSPTLVGTSASVFFGNMREGGISGGSFVNSGTINVNPTGSHEGATLNFDLSGGYVPFQLTNAGAINVTDGTLSIRWASAYGGLRPFVVNTGTITVQSTTALDSTTLNAVGGTNQPSDVVGIQNNGTIVVNGVQGYADQTVADFNQVSGTGSISVDDATVGFVGNVTAGETLKFISDPTTHVGDNTLNLNMGKATFGATIAGFGQGDRINLGLTLSQSQLFYDPKTGVLSADGGTVKLHFAGSYTASDFTVASNPDGTSAIIASPSATIPLSDLLPAGAVHDAAPLPQATAAGGAAGDAGQIAGGSASLADVLAALHAGAAQGAFHAGGVS